MSEEAPKEVLLIGGAMDGRRVTVRHGREVMFRTRASFNDPEVRSCYQIERFDAEGTTFWMGVLEGMTIQEACAKLFAGYRS